MPENHFAARRDWLHRRQRQRKAEQQEHRSGWGRPAVHPQRSGLCQTPAAVAPTGHGQPARSLKLSAQQQRRNATTPGSECDQSNQQGCVKYCIFQLNSIILEYF